MADKNNIDRGSLQLSLTSVDAKGRELEILTQYIKALKYTREETGADKLELQIDNNELDNWSSRTSARFMQGRHLRLSFGYQSVASVVAFLRVTRVKGFTSLTVKAKNIGDQLNRDKKVRAWKNKTRAEIIRQIAREHGMTVALIDDTGERYDRITQSRETDAQFCHRLAYKEGFKFSINQEGLRWSARDFGKKEKLELVHHVSGTGDILDVTLDMDIARLPRRIKSKALNRETGEEESSEVDNKTDKDRDVATEFSGWIPEASGGKTHLVIQSEVIKTAKPTETEKDAKARFRLAQQRAVKLGLKIIGNPHIEPRDIIRVSGIGDVLSGLYYVKCVESEMSPSVGWVDTLELTTDGVNRGGAGRGTGADPRSIIEACIQEIGVVLSNLNSPGDLFGETGLFLESLKASISGGKNPSAAVIQDLIDQASYNVVNLRAVGAPDAAILVENCRANLAIIQDTVGEEERNQGVKNASFPEDGDTLEAALFVENEGQVPASIEGGSEAIESLGVTNDSIFIKHQ